ncbi:MAG: hypothetical protein COB85_06600 [Bacteroidetes bacterium]|nr:MAG: hypothetical protein COB85_06600 [Bacteroidota bacterium]
MRFILSIIALLIWQSAQAQPVFQRGLGGSGADMGRVLRTTADGGYILAGRTTSFGAGGDDIYVVKLDAFADTLWTKAIGGPLDEAIVDVEIRQTVDNGYGILTNTYNDSTGISELLLVRLDAFGNTLWAKTYARGSGDSYGYDLEPTADGGFILAGRLNYSVFSSDATLIKTDSNGDTLWTKIYGGSQGDAFYSVRTTQDGGYIAAGGSQSLGTGNTFDIYLVKTDSLGNQEWARSYGGGVGSDWAYTVQTIDDGGYVLGGQTLGFGQGNFDLMVLKTDSGGNLDWMKTYGGSSIEFFGHIEQTFDGGYILTGSTGVPNNGQNALLIKINDKGDTTWTMTYGGQFGDNGEYVQQTADGGYMLLGTTSNFGLGLSDAYLVKTDSLGITGCNEIRSELIPADAVPLQNSGGGTNSGMQTADWVSMNTGTATQQSVLNFNPPLANFTYVDSILAFSFTDASSNATSWLWYFGDGAYSFLQNPEHTYLVDGWNLVCLTVNGDCGEDTYCENVNAVIPGVNDFKNNSFLLYPNPTTGDTRVEVKTGTLIQAYHIYDLSGKLVRLKKVNAQQSIVIERGNLDSGLYYFELMSENQVIGREKMLIQ